MISGTRYARWESERLERATHFDAGTSLDAVPRLTGNITVKRRPIFAEGEFQWSEVLASSKRPEGIAVSPLVAAMISEIDDSRSVDEIIRRIASMVSQPKDSDGISKLVLSTLRILAVDGLIECHDPGIRP